MLDFLTPGELDGIATRPLVVGGPDAYGGQAPLVVNEWDGFGFAMYGAPAHLNTRADRIRAFERALRARGVAGDV